MRRPLFPTWGVAALYEVGGWVGWGEEDEAV